MMPHRAKSPAFRFRALPADEVTLSILQRLSLQNEESAQWPNAPEWLLPLGTTLNQSRRRALLR
jgi:hypothetical protein